MLRPAMNDILKDGQSYYSFVLAVAKRARDIAIDATYGRRTRAVIITDSEHVILSALQPETIGNRFYNKDDGEDESDGE